MVPSAHDGVVAYTNTKERITGMACSRDRCFADEIDNYSAKPT